MFSRRLQIRKVRRYPTPAYPVVEAHQTLYRPPEMRLGELVRDLARPVMPLVLSAAVLTTRGESSSARAATAGPPAVLMEGRAEAWMNSTEARRVQEEEKAPYPIRTLTREQIVEMVKNLDPWDGEVPGTSPRAPWAVLTESNGRQVLTRFFKKNGIEFRSDVDFRRDGVEFKIDAYDEDRKLGFEFLSSADEQDLTHEEQTRLQKGLKGESILLLIPKSQEPSLETVVLDAVQKAEKFLRHVYETGAVGKGSEIREHIRALGSDDEPKRAEAARALKDIGLESVWWLRQALVRMGKMESYSADKSALKACRERVVSVIDSIREDKVASLLDQLETGDLSERGAAADQLTEMGPAVGFFIEERRREAKAEEDHDLESWCGKILRSLGQ